MRDLVVRPLVTTDEPLLAAATLENLNWTGRHFTMKDVQERPEFRHYTQLVLGRGDFGLVAGDAGGSLAVASAMFFPADDPGYGFLDESTPEISLWVREDFRGRGVGRLLLRRLQQETATRGLPGLSLSVEAGNYAKRLYASEGFRQVIGRKQDGLMMWAC
ncbi:GNAT family N-acetyltransferase [Serinicoccus sp. LYQ131]|uniref:GNAT family N-acetyltransferase n=1 Tax=Serinicoccus sp. LYQ131 TaxID=3378797 RepID=UPI0038521BF4